MSSEARIELFSPGSLGTCWYGKYHYLEPWVGCGHACPYCYARTRAAVSNSLADHGTSFGKPALLHERAELLERIADEANSGRIDTLKLCRYTDLFTPECVADGLTYEILEVLADSKVRRVIITTKGLPDEKSIRLMIAKAEKFSYNAAARPSAVVDGSPLAGLDAGLAPLEARLAAAAALSAAGVQTTIHMDPFVVGFDDRDEALRPFLALLRRHGLNRVMFSYLLLSDVLIDAMKDVVPADALSRVLANYNLSGLRIILPGQEDTASHSLRDDALRSSAEATASVLAELGFEFVLCSLKSVRGLDTKKFGPSRICDGKFYA